MFICRALMPGDIPAAAAIEATVADGWSANAITEFCAQPTSRCFAAVADEAEADGGAPGGQTQTGTFDASTAPGGTVVPDAFAAPGGQTAPDAFAAADGTDATRGEADTGGELCAGSQLPGGERSPGVPAAFAAFTLVCGEASLLALSTDAAQRRKGAARAVLTGAFAALAAEGAQCVFLEVRSRNTPAKALYAALGFVPVGFRARFYTDPADDAILMKKDFG